MHQFCMKRLIYQTYFLLVDGSHESLVMDYNVRVFLLFIFADVAKYVSSAQHVLCSGDTTVQGGRKRKEVSTMSLPQTSNSAWDRK